jgi:tetratricopeptide (TPR) repeat protein
MTLADLASALPATPDPVTIRPALHRLTDLTLLTPGSEIAMHPWTADLITRNAPDLTPQHERALATRGRRFEQQHGTYDDLIDIPRHLAYLSRYDEIANETAKALRAIPGTLTALAYLAEVRSLIPPTERAWFWVTDLGFDTLLAGGDLDGATSLFEAAHQQNEARAAADPVNTEWQRDLSISHNKLGDLATTTGDLTTARDHYQAALDIRSRLTAADPANTQWQRDLAFVQDRLACLDQTEQEASSADSSAE